MDEVRVAGEVEAEHLPCLTLVPVGASEHLRDGGHSGRSLIEVGLDHDAAVLGNGVVAGEHLESGVAPGEAGAEGGSDGYGRRLCNWLRRRPIRYAFLVFDRCLLFDAPPHVLVAGGLRRVVEPVEAGQEAEVGRPGFASGDRRLDPCVRVDANDQVSLLDLRGQQLVSEIGLERFEKPPTGRVR